MKHDALHDFLPPIAGDSIKLSSEKIVNTVVFNQSISGSYNIKLIESRPQKRVFCSGNFDLTHYGHALFFKECKELGDHLTVMVASDRVARINKGDDRPILPFEMREGMVKAIRWVDEVITDDHLPRSPNDFKSLEDVFITLKPHIYVVNRDAKYLKLREQLCHNYGVVYKFIPTVRKPSLAEISTSSIIKKIQGLSVEGKT